MNVKIIQVGNLDTNCYILEKEGFALVIDPGDNFLSIQKQIGNNQLLGVLITHRHPDHIGALSDLLNLYSVPLFEQKTVEEKKYEVGPFRFTVIFTPGHTSDSISFYFEDYLLLFSGDFLFKNTIGRTDMPTGSMEQMQCSIEKIKTYSDRIKVHPGHGESTKLGIEKEQNPFFK